MKSERYQSKTTSVWLVVALVTFGIFYSINEHRTLISFWTQYTLIGTVLIGFIYFTYKRTYLQINEEKVLLNKGYRNLKRDTLEIEKIIYIGKIFSGVWQTLVIYYLGPNGEVWHSSTSLLNYGDKVLQKFLRRLVELNPKIELGSNYQDMVAGDDFDKYRLFESDNIWDIEKILKEKGYKVKPISWSDRFLGY